MKRLRKFLPDLLASAGVICIVAALWMVHPILGLIGLGGSLISGAILYIIYSIGGAK